MSTDEPGTNPYELLNVGLEATDQEIKSAYRKLSLKVHPDRNRNNPDAAQKFHELNQAYELLLDPLRRLALTSSVRTKEARKARYSKYDQKRKNLQEELEERERALKKQKLGKAKEAREREQENERIKEAGRKLREEKGEEALKKQAESNAKIADEEEEEDDVPPLGQLDTTIKLKYSLSSRPSLNTASALSSLLSQFGEIDTSSIVLSLKPPKKAPTKPPKSGTALVPFKQIGGAFAAACASGTERTRAGGRRGDVGGRKEPPILEWLKKQGRLSAEPPTERESARSSPPTVSQKSEPEILSKASKLPGSSAFSSFPDSFSSAPEPPTTQTTAPNLPGLDYESLTLMRLRQAERNRLEQEIREQEANE
ncbi:DnaJ-domain-containing protein [Phellopilus nigrolimitatus]|nr:DnaJ-domain-containing protein [Phellopilus nigrolimitatus]